MRNQAHAVVQAHNAEVPGPATPENFARFNEFALIDRVAPHAETFIDVGVNMGWWSTRFASRMTRPPVGLLVEPDIDRYDHLQVDFARWPGVELLKGAASDYLGAATFQQNRSNPRRSSLHDYEDVKALGDDVVRYEVPITTLDREVERLGWDRVTFVKIDAEGEDFYVLRGMRRLLSERRVDFVQIEYCDWIGVSLRAVTEFLRPFGYELFQLHPEGVRSIDVDYFGDGGSGDYVALHPGSPDVGLRFL